MEIKSTCPGIEDNRHCLKSCNDIGSCKKFNIGNILSTNKESSIFGSLIEGVKNKVGVIILAIGILFPIIVDKYIELQVSSLINTNEKINKEIYNKINDFENIIDLLIYLISGLITSLIVFIIGEKELDRKHSKQKSEYLELTLSKLIKTLEDLKEKEVLLNNSLKRIEQSNDAKLRFLSNLAHELRSPLNIVMGYTDTVLVGTFGELNGKQREYLQHSLASGKFLLELINNILESSKIESGNLDIQLGEHDLKKSILEVIEMLDIESQKKDINVMLFCENEDTIMNYDEIKIKQVLLNLIKNAIKFTNKGGNIRINLKEINGKIIIEIIDDGIGISKENIEKLGNPFIQAENGAKLNLEGTGLGLYISKGIIEAHSGTFKIDSEGEGKGTTVTITLPKN